MITAELKDLMTRGGFVGTEKLLKQNIEKLLLEIERLKPNMTEQISNISNIASNITSALAFFT